VVDGGVLGESCDDGADNGTYGHCLSDCSGMGEHCGDGIINGPEDCELDSPLCGQDCFFPVCGDGVCECGSESPDICPADCGGGVAGGCQPGSLGQPGMCCGNGTTNPGECVVYDSMGLPGTRNCGSCGNHCGTFEVCNQGQCTEM
jgi:hypothetical protein